MSNNRFYDASVGRYISEDEALSRGFDSRKLLDDGNARIRHDVEANPRQQARRLPRNLPEEYEFSDDYQFGG